MTRLQCPMHDLEHDRRRSSGERLDGLVTMRKLEKPERQRVAVAIALLDVTPARKGDDHSEQLARRTSELAREFVK